MNSGERANNNQESREHLSREENLKLIWDMPAISLLVEMGIAANDIKEMDEDTINDLRVRLEERLAATDQAEEVAETPAEETAEVGTPAEEEGPAIIPPETPDGIGEDETPAEGPAEGEPSEDESDPEEVETPAEGDSPEEGEEPAGEDGEVAEEEGDVAEATPEESDAKPEKKKSFWTRNRRIGGAVLAVIASATFIAGQFGLFTNNNNNAGATGTPNTPPAYEQVEQETSREFEIVGTDYRGRFLNEAGDAINPDKESKYAIGMPFPSEYRENNDQEGALEEVFNRLCSQPEHLAMFASTLDDEYKILLGVDGIDGLQNIEAHLEDEENLQQAKEGLRDLFMNHVERLNFTETNGYVYSYYMTTTGGEISNDSGSIVAARSQVILRNGDEAINLDFINGTSTPNMRELCSLQPDIPVEEGTPEEDIEPNLPKITIEIDEPDPGTGTETGTETGNEDGTGEETGNEDGTGEETGNEDGTGQETGTETGNEDGTGEETGNEDGTGQETGTETGVETGNEDGTGEETGVETGNENSEEPPKGENPHASDPDLDPDDNGGGIHNPDTDLDDADGDAPEVTEEEAREANDGNEGYDGGAGSETNPGGGAQLPGSSSGSETVNPGTEGADGSGDNGGSRADTPPDESEGFNGETTDYTEGLDTDAEGNQAQEDANAEVDQGGGDGSVGEGNYTDSEEESLVEGGNF